MVSTLLAAHHMVHQRAFAGALWSHDCHYLVLGSSIYDPMLRNKSGKTTLLKRSIPIDYLAAVSHNQQLRSSGVGPAVIRQHENEVRQSTGHHHILADQAVSQSPNPRNDR